jgi:hypothetical protein
LGEVEIQFRIPHWNAFSLPFPSRSAMPFPIRIEEDMLSRAAQFIAALGLFLAVNAAAGTLYVSLNSTNPVSPFNSWATAATNIQDAVDASMNGDIILVTNGVYQTGSMLTGDGAQNRVVVTNTVTIQAVNGPSVTTINGLNVMRCLFLGNGLANDPGNGGVLTGFTLAHGNATQGGGSYGGTLNNCTLSNNAAVGMIGTIGGSAHGGGAIYATLNNCILSGNSASSIYINDRSGGGVYVCTLNNCALSGNSAQYGGAAYYCTANNCSFSNNSANGSPSGYGGGTMYSTLNNCTLSGNSASFGGATAYATVNNCTLIGNSAAGNGGGDHGSTLNNSIVYYNSAPFLLNFTSSSTFNFCCTTPLPSSGTGNIVSAPFFVNLAGGDYHLQSNSPCINAGNNAFVSGPTDLDDRPRIMAANVDMGSYEYVGAFNAWLQQYGLATNGSADFMDPDHDGLNNYQEWCASTDPTNSSSKLLMLNPTNSGSNIIVTWQSVVNKLYYLQRGANLAAQPVFQPLATNLTGHAGTTSYTDTNAAGPGPFFYRVGVQ